MNLANVARAGYAAKGVVYAIVAWFAIEAAFVAGARTMGSKGALARILSEPFGQVLLGILALGLAAYALWRFVQAIGDPENKGNGLEGVSTRALYFGSGILHASLVIWVAKLVSGNGGASPQRSGADSFAEGLMSQVYGQWLVAGAGVLVIAFGVLQIVEGYGETFTKQLDLSQLSRSAKAWLVRSGKLGLIARGVVFGIVGGFFIVAAYRANPERAKGVGEALRALERAPYGPYLLGVVGVGLLGYAVHQLVKARFRTFPSSA